MEIKITGDSKDLQKILDLIPQGGKVLVWTTCFYCNKYTPLVRMKAHIRLRHGQASIPMGEVKEPGNK